LINTCSDNYILTTQNEVILTPGIQPILDRFLLPDYLFALGFRDGWLFGRTVRRRICQYAPYCLTDSNGDAIDIAESSHQAALWFRDPRNTANDMLYLGASSNAGFPWFLHGAIGLKPQQIYMYLRNPDGKDIPGKFPNCDPIRPSSGDNMGYVDSLLSPYEEPTDVYELVIPPYQHISAEYYNTDAERAIQPAMKILFSVYWVQFFRPEEPRQNALIRKIAAREVPAAFLSCGFGDFPIDLGGQLEREWNVKELTLEEAMQ